MTLLWLTGSALVFAGERIFGAGSTRWILDLFGLLLIIASLGLRARGMSDSSETRKQGQTQSLIWSSVGASAFLVYAISTPECIDLLGLNEEAAWRWKGTWQSIVPILWVIGTAPAMLIDLALAQNPKMLPLNAPHKALVSGLIGALALCLVVPVNYLANNYRMEWDTAYFRVTRPGDATINVVRTLPEPINVYLFFPTGNEVAEEIRPYFDAVQNASNGLLHVEFHDQALAASLSEELKIRENGWVVLQGSGEPEKFKLNAEIDKAKRQLKKLDGDFQKSLLRVSRGERVAYLLAGHEEASASTKDNTFRKIPQLKRLIQMLGYKVKPFGAAQGSTTAVPEDADIVMIFDPVRPIAETEVAALTAYADAGGSLFIATSPDGDPMTPLLGHLGIKRLPGMLADPEKKLSASPFFMFTDRFGTHNIVKVLSDVRTGIPLPRGSALDKLPDAQGTHTVLIRTHSSTFSDFNTNAKQDGEEKNKVYNVAYAVEGEAPNAAAGSSETEGEESKSGFRAVIIGNVATFSDWALARKYGQGGQLVIDSMRWLAHEGDLVGETSSEEDVKVEHSPGGQKGWFWAGILGVPLLVLLTGGVHVTIRRRRK